MKDIQHKLAVARGEEPAELLFANARVCNVFSGEIHEANVAVEDGRVIGFGEYEARETIDLAGAYLAPGLIDGHFHVESTMVTVSEFARAVVPHGTSAMVIDPHEYANVLGLDGIRYVLDSTRNLPIDFFIMLPSCVPATHLETAGAKFTAASDIIARPTALESGVRTVAIGDLRLLITNRLPIHEVFANTNENRSY